MTCTTSHTLSFSTNQILPHRSSNNSSPSHVTFRRPLPSISASYATFNETTHRLPTTATTSSPSSYYDLLGVQDEATCKEIKAAYRMLARVLHPDAASSRATSSVDEFIRVHEAYATLSDPVKRADYDKMLLFKRRRFASSINYSNNKSVGVSNCGATSYSRFSGYTRRTWETDQCW